MQHNTIQTKKGEQKKYRLTHKYALTHKIKITKISLEKGISDWKLIFQHQLWQLIRDISYFLLLINGGKYFEKNSISRKRIYRSSQNYCKGSSGATYLWFTNSLSGFALVKYAVWPLCLASLSFFFFSFVFCVAHTDPSGCPRRHESLDDLWWP